MLKNKHVVLTYLCSLFLGLFIFTFLSLVFPLNIHFPPLGSAEGAFPDGSLDTTFVQTGTGLSSTVNSVAIQGDGKIIVGGGFTTYNGVSRPRLARLNTDGTLDITFVQTGTGFDSTVNSVAIQEDSKIIVGGAFVTYNGVSRPYVARLNTDGTLDTTFVQTGTGLSGTVTSIAIQGDGKIIVGGYFETYNGVSRPYLARLNTDGTLDTTFVQTGTGFDSTVKSIAIQEDGKIIVGGYFATYNGVSRPRLARINTNGTLDTSFVQTGTGLNDYVSSVAIQGDGKIIVGGKFVTYNGVSTPRVARINTDGTLDNIFVQTGTGLDWPVISVAIQEDSKIIVGGAFTSYDTTSLSRITRLYSEPEEYDITYNLDGGSNNGGNPATYTIETSTITLLDPTKTGYTFSGWFSEAEFTNEITEITLGSTVDVSLFAKWTINTYTVSFNGNTNTGGSVPTAITQNYNTQVTVPANTGSLTKIGYTFNGWNTLVNGTGTPYVATNTFNMPVGGITLYAQWTINEYTVSFNGNTNTGGSVPSNIDQNYNTQVTVPGNTGSLTKTGYTFNGWNTLANGSGTGYVATNTFNMPVGGATLYAQWTTVEYDITYNLDGGSNNGGNPATYTIETSTITLLDPTKTGYTFGGWFSEAEFTNEITTIVLGSTGDVTLYTKFTINEYTVSFDGNTSTEGSVPTAIIQNYNTQVTVPGNTGLLTKTGYTFNGWNTLANGSGTTYVATNTFNMPATNSTLYAQWTINTYTVSFNGNTNDGGSVPSNIDQNYNTQVTVPGNTGSLTKTGYTFNGWNTLANGTGTPYVATNTFNMPVGGITLYAQWTINEYNITYNLDDGTNNGSNPATYTIETSTITLLDPTKTGYTFNGWFSEAEFTNEITAITIGSTGDETLYAKFTINEYTVSFDGNTNTGGSVPSDIDQNYNTQVTVPGNTGSLTKIGYTFNGWNTLANGTGTPYVATNTFNMPVGGIILYAQWTINEYTVSFDGNTSTGGSVPTAITQNYNTQVTVPANTGSLTKTGYTFNGWNTLANGSGTTYVATNTFNMPATNTTLYAKWTLIPVNTTPQVTTPTETEEIPEQEVIEEIPKEEEITQEEIIQVKTILLETDELGEEINQEVGVTITVGESIIDTKGKETVHMYQDSGIDISIPVRTLTGGDSGIDNVYAVLGENVVKLTLNTIGDKYVGKLTSGNLSGEHKIDILTIFKDSTSKRSNLSISIDPYGYVYSIREGDKQLRINDATITLYKIVDGERTLYISNEQDNPQQTDVEGQYSFIVEPGTYVLVVKADGYKNYDSGEFEIETTIIEKNILIERAFNIFDYWGYILISLIFIPISTALIRKKKSIPMV